MKRGSDEILLLMILVRVQQLRVIPLVDWMGMVTETDFVDLARHDVLFTQKL
jgi:hypothetical protein